eukprot:SAG11_NODE_6495_length_1302_cov_1.963425_3_plen_98_part_00
MQSSLNSILPPLLINFPHYSLKASARPSLKGWASRVTDSISTPYADAKKLYEDKAAMAQAASGAAGVGVAAEDEITVSLKEELPYSGVELQVTSAQE